MSEYIVTLYLFGIPSLLVLNMIIPIILIFRMFQLKSENKYGLHTLILCLGSFPILYVLGFLPAYGLNNILVNFPDTTGWVYAIGFTYTYIYCFIVQIIYLFASWILAEK